MADDRVQAGGRTSASWSSLSSRLALLIAVILILSGLVTAVYSALAARGAAATAAESAMANAHGSTGLLIDQAYADTQRARTTAMDSRAAELKNVAAPIIPMLDQLRAAVSRGEMSLAQAQQAGLEGIKAIRFRADDYFFVYDKTGTAIAHPNPKFQDQNLIGLQDPNGVYVVRDLLAIARDSGSAGGYLDYEWVKLDEDQPSPKLGFAFAYPPWNWTIGTGVYVDDIDEEAAARLEATKEALGSSFARIDLAEGGFLVVLDKNGAVAVAPSARDLSWVTTTDEGRSVAGGLIEAAPAQEGQIAQVSELAAFNGSSEPWVMDVSRFNALGWTLVSAVPQASIEAPGNSLAVRQALLGLVVLVIGLLIGLLASRRIVRPVETMTKAALALESDTFDPSLLDAAAARKDEVGTLARAFQRMGAEVIQRERKLREQVMKLTVVIDRAKVAEEAGAIADSDYFKTLAQQADKLRDRRSDVTE